MRFLTPLQLPFHHVPLEGDIITSYLVSLKKCTFCPELHKLETLKYGLWKGSASSTTNSKQELGTEFQCPESEQEVQHLEVLEPTRIAESYCQMEANQSII